MTELGGSARPLVAQGQMRLPVAYANALAGKWFAPSRLGRRGGRHPGPDRPAARVTGKTGRGRKQQSSPTGRGATWGRLG